MLLEFVQIVFRAPTGATEWRLGRHGSGLLDLGESMHGKCHVEEPLGWSRIRSPPRCGSAPGRRDVPRAALKKYRPFTAPLDIVYKSRTLDRDTMSASDTFSESVRRILVVDDDEDAREVVKELLENEKFAVFEASNGQEALDALGAHPETALVVLDLNMPVMSGTELLARMKADERLASIPVLILSGTTPSNAPQAQSVVGFLSKPCDMKSLVRAVAAHASRRDGVLAAVPRP
ncbi:MAG TPA: response regulator [Polyangiaceae bacterium]